MGLDNSSNNRYFCIHFDQALLQEMRTRGEIAYEMHVSKKKQHLLIDKMSALLQEAYRVHAVMPANINSYELDNELSDADSSKLKPSTKQGFLRFMFNSVFYALGKLLYTHPNIENFRWRLEAQGIHDRKLQNKIMQTIVQGNNKAPFTYVVPRIVTLFLHHLTNTALYIAADSTEPSFRVDSENNAYLSYTYKIQTTPTPKNPAVCGSLRVELKVCKEQLDISSIDILFDNNRLKHESLASIKKIPEILGRTNNHYIRVPFIISPEKSEISATEKSNAISLGQWLCHNRFNVAKIVAIGVALSSGFTAYSVSLPLQSLNLSYSMQSFTLEVIQSLCALVIAAISALISHKTVQNMLAPERTGYLDSHFQLPTTPGETQHFTLRTSNFIPNTTPKKQMNALQMLLDTKKVIKTPKHKKRHHHSAPDTFRNEEPRSSQLKLRPSSNVRRRLFADDEKDPSVVKRLNFTPLGGQENKENSTILATGEVNNDNMDNAQPQLLA